MRDFLNCKNAKLLRNLPSIRRVDGYNKYRTPVEFSRRHRADLWGYQEKKESHGVCELSPVVCALADSSAIVTHSENSCIQSHWHHWHEEQSAGWEFSERDLTASSCTRTTLMKSKGCAGQNVCWPKWRNCLTGLKYFCHHYNQELRVWPTWLIHGVCIRKMYLHTSCNGRVTQALQRT